MSSLPRRRNPPVMEPPPFRVLSPLSPELPPPPRTPEPNRVFPPQVHVRRQPTTAFVILADEPETPRRSSSPFRGRGFKESKIPVAKGTLVGARSAPQSRHQSPSKIPRLRGSTPSPTPHKPDHSKKRVNARPPRPLDNHGTIGRKTKVPILDNARSKSTTSINSVHTTDVKHKNLVQQKNLKNAGFKKEKNVERFAVERNGRDSKKIFDKKTKIDPENRFVKEVKEEKEDATSAGPIKIEVAGKPEESLALESSTIINEQGKGSSLGERAESTVTIIQINNEPTTNNRSRVLENLVAARAARRVAAGLTDFKTSLQQRNAHKAALAAEAAARVAAQAAAQAAVSKTEIKPEVVPPVPAVRESIPKAVSPEVKVISNSNNPDARTSSPEVLSKVQGHIVAEIETDPARTNGGLKMNGLKSERPRPVTELLTTDLDALEEEARNSLGIIGDSEEDVSGTVSEPPEVDNQSGNRPRSKVSFKSPELRPLTSDLKQEQPGLWNKISGRVKTYCKIGPVKKKPGRKNANLLPPEKLAKIQTKPAEVKDIVKEPVKDIKIPVNNNETTDDNSNEKKDVNSVETKETDAKSKKDTKIDKDTKNVSKDSKKAAAKSVDKKTGKEEPGKKGVLGRVRARLRTCFKRKKRTGPGLLARMNCFKARKRKTINKDIKPPFWKRLSCSCCKTCARGNKAAPENNNKKPGGAKPARKTSLGGQQGTWESGAPPEDYIATEINKGFPKLEAALVEHNSVMRGAIPVLPLPLAWICLLLNVFLPGIGTLVSGLFCLCFGKPRFSVDDTSVARFGSFCVNFLVAVSQTFTILFCLVGWGWSIWWGVLIIKLARKNRRIKQVKLVEKKTAETQESKHRDPEAGR